jgi:hypothetical protein
VTLQTFVAIFAIALYLTLGGRGGRARCARLARWEKALVRRCRRRWLVWRGGRWVERFVRCYECGAVSRGKRVYVMGPGVVVTMKWLGCGHPVTASRRWRTLPLAGVGGAP